MDDIKLVIEEIDDPLEIARCREQDASIRMNSQWLQANWASVLPRARGKFIAVAGQEAFIADTQAQAWKLARAAHPEDIGAISQFVLPEGGARVYACRG